MSAPPVVLPPGWEVRADNWGRPFYVDHTTGSTQWHPPVALSTSDAPAKPAAPPSYDAVSAPPVYDSFDAPQPNYVSQPAAPPGFGPAGPAGAAYSVPHFPPSGAPPSVFPILLPAQIYANGQNCPEFQQMGFTAPRPKMHESDCGDALNYCCGSAKCSIFTSIVQLGLFAFMIFSIWMHKEQQARDRYYPDSWLLGIIMPAVFGTFLWITSVTVHATQVGCCICCNSRSASLRPALPNYGTGFAGSSAPLNDNFVKVNHEVARHSACCVIPATLAASAVTAPASEADALAHFEKMRTSPVRLLVKIRCGHWTRRGKHNHFLVTFTAEIPCTITAAYDFSNTVDDVSAVLRSSSGDTVLVEFDSAYEASPQSLEIINATRAHYEGQYGQLDVVNEVTVEYSSGVMPDTKAVIVERKSGGSCCAGMVASPCCLCVSFLTCCFPCYLCLWRWCLPSAVFNSRKAIAVSPQRNAPIVGIDLLSQTRNPWMNAAHAVAVAGGIVRNLMR